MGSTNRSALVAYVSWGGAVTWQESDRIAGTGLLRAARPETLRPARSNPGPKRMLPTRDLISRGDFQRLLRYLPARLCPPAVGRFSPRLQGDRSGSLACRISLTQRKE